MTGINDFDRQLGAWFEERATSTPPEGLLERSLARVDMTRQRPGWLANDGWSLTIPRASTTPSVTFGRRQNLAILVAAALLVVALVGGAIAVGAGLIRLPSVLPPTPDVSPAVTPPPSISEPSPSPTTEATPTSPASATWTPTGNMIELRFGESATLLPNGKVLVAGGRSDWGGHGVARASAELFDPSTDQWSLSGSMHTARQEHTAVPLANGAVLVLGGDASGGGLSHSQWSAELYDPGTGAWTGTGRMAAAREGATATVLPDGRVLVTGGFSSLHEGGAIASAEIYDPATGAWSKTAAMRVARQGHTATLLPDGQVLVVGGGCCDQPARASAELYDPVTGTWKGTGSLGAARLYHTAVLLGNGKVLLYGGDNRSDHPAVTTAELYDPVTGAWTATGSPGSPGNVFEALGSGQAGRLPDGRIFAAAYGGAGELYDPATGSWTRVVGMSGDPSTVTYIHTCTLLPDGRALVTTEQFPAAGGGPILVAALFDPTGRP